VAVSARYGPPSVQDFLDMQDTDEGSASKDIGLPQLSSNLSDNNPLFSVTSQIAARSRENMSMKRKRNIQAKIKMMRRKTTRSLGIEMATMKITARHHRRMKL
jgi:hypothetical protein